MAFGRPTPRIVGGGIGGRPQSPTMGNQTQAAQAQAATYRPDIGRALTDAEYQAAVEARGQQQAA